MKRNILTGLMSLAIAFGLWLYVVTVVSPNSDNTYRNVPVALQGEAILEERGLMIITRDIPNVDLRLEGNRSELQKLNSSNITVTVDVSKIAEPGEHTLTVGPGNIRFPGDVSDNAINVASRNPDKITLEVRRRATKNIPVTIQYNGTVPEGFIADKENSMLDHKEIQVSGPADVVSTIATARIEQDLTGKNSTVSESLPFTLCDNYGQPVDAQLITTNVGEVNFTLRILRVKQVDLKLNVLEGGGATLQNAIVEMDSTSILVSGSDSVLQDLTQIELGTVNLGELKEDSTLVFPINLPEGVGNETGISEVIVKIRFSRLESKTLDISRITAINVPEGQKAELITKTLEITFRGPKKQIDKLKADHVTVTVDFANAQTGTATMRAVITLHEDFAQVGAVGVYTVSATLK